VVLSERAVPAPRQLTVTGQAVPALSAVEALVVNDMKRSGARAASLAIARKGKLVYARGLTWAEAGYPVTQPASSFRIASMSKPRAATAAFQLIQQGRLAPGDRMQDALQLPAPADARWAQVTLDQLLSHSGGWNRDTTFDPIFHDNAIAAALNVPLPIDKRQIALYMARQPLQFDPGTQYAYSNFGYSLIGQMIEKATGAAYEQSVQHAVLRPPSS